jgi:hypothetical protein
VAVVDDTKYRAIVFECFNWLDCCNEVENLLKMLSKIGCIRKVEDY